MLVITSYSIHYTKLYELITENQDEILQTIQSRCQVIDFLAVDENSIAQSLIKHKGCEENLAYKIAHQSNGNYNKALHLFNRDADEFPRITSYNVCYTKLLRACLKKSMQ